MSLKGNAIVIQSGGPTQVINQSLAGIITTAREFPQIERIFGAEHGLHGLLYENLLDLSAEPAGIWDEIAYTPGAALGSVRLKPKASDMDRIFKVFTAHNIKFVFYNGGNDSAEAAQLIRQEANARHYDIRILHVPKTIDNDLMETDHCPGFGSVARVVANLVAGDDLDNRSFHNGVKINICMGRHAGWIAGAAALGKSCALDSRYDDAGPHLIYLPEVKFEMKKFLDDVQNTYDRVGRATIVVAEGIADQVENHRFEGELDEFGNPQLSGSGALGDWLSDAVKRNLKVNTELGKLRVRADTWGYMQRSLPDLASPSDQAEAFLAGAMAVRYMMQGETDKMVTLVRSPGEKYHISTGLCDLALVAQKTKHVPQSWINSAGNFVTDEFIRYCAPLANILPRVRRLHISPVARKLDAYHRG